MTPLLLLLACAPRPDSASQATLTVLAASSLTEAYTELGEAFEAQHPEVELSLSFAGSQTLATWVRHGVAADVLASADEAHLRALGDEGLALPARAFAGNRLVIAVAGDHAPAGLEDLPALGSLVLAAPDVPLGRYSREALDAAEARLGAGWRARVDAGVVSLEPNARLVVAKLALGEADAAIVYATDIAGVDGLVALPLPLGPEAGYFHAPLVDAPSPALAEAWLRFVESAAGQERLRAHGFLRAPQ